jgi:hypothetical protein
MPNTLQTGESLASDGRITANSNAYRLIMQSDGNLVLYASEHTVPQNAIWSSNTCNKSPFIGPYGLIMQDDGNLVVYDAYSRPVWASDTCHKGARPHRLVMQDDGNLVIYDGNNQPTWASNTCR